MFVSARAGARSYDFSRAPYGTDAAPERPRTRGGGAAGSGGDDDGGGGSGGGDGTVLWGRFNAYNFELKQKKKKIIIHTHTRV